MNPNNPSNDSHWLLGDITDFVSGEECAITLECKNPFWTAKFRYRLKDKCKEELLARMASRRAMAAFLVEREQAVDFSIPWIGTPRALAVDLKDRQFYEFTLSTGASYFRIHRDHPQFSDLQRAVDRENVALIIDWDSRTVQHCVIPYSRRLCRGDESPPLRMSDPPRTDPQNATTMFQALSDLDCKEGRAHNNTCIPYLYPLDGCEARAHAGWDHLRANFDQWQDSLVKIRAGGTAKRFCHPNNPSSDKLMRWEFHVAVAVAVESDDEFLILDPALFSEPKPILVWIKRFEGNEDWERMPVNAFKRDKDWTVDDKLNCTRKHLEYLRDCLDYEICLRRGQWPPYHTCP
jgi:hypothetical protein